MSDLNCAFLVGRLTHDPEMRYLPQGAPVCEFSLASNRYFNRKDGEKVEQVIFIDVVAWNHLAEICAEYLKKGRQILVSGQLIQDRWEAKDTGQKRSKIRIQADHVQFLDSASMDDGGSVGESSPAEAPSEESPVDTVAAPERPAPTPSTSGAKGRATARR